ncbi:GPI ethanolamine phosphate transferase [Trichinella pseudospiralis]
MIYCSATVFLENVSKSGPDFARESESDCRQTLLVWKRFFCLFMIEMVCCSHNGDYKIFAPRFAFGCLALFVHLSRVGETIVDQSVSERAHWYPKDGELCLSRMKPEETLVEVRSGVDVQITRLT